MKRDTIELEHLITFCKVYYNFDSLCRDMIDLFDYYDCEIFNILDSVVSGTSNEFHAKLFYNKHKTTLNIIQNNSGISNFFNCIYGDDCYFSDKFRLFYHYIREYRIHLNDILELLLSIKKLGVTYITLDLVNNLKSLRHAIYNEFEDNDCINYVGDIDFVPEYSDRIIYKSINGDYILKLKVFGSDYYSNGREIIVSNLLFDKQSLPNVITRENTYEKIMEEKSIIDNKYNAINNVIELSSVIDTLNDTISKLRSILNNIDIESEKYNSVYEEIINKIRELESIRDLYEENIIREYNIDKKDIEYQRRLSLN